MVYALYSDPIKVKNNNFIRNSAEHVTIDFKMDDGCALSIIGGSLMTLIAVIFIGFNPSKSQSDYHRTITDCGPGNYVQQSVGYINVYYSFWNSVKRTKTPRNYGKCE